MPQKSFECFLIGTLEDFGVQYDYVALNQDALDLIFLAFLCILY